MRAYEQAATEGVADLRVELSRAEDFAATLRVRLQAAGESLTVR
ncbi:hypothetical protein GCM10010495_80720 [Kitasatospora herbaricolor]|nr:hypothetical protein [Kitasatospora herbaricolor]MDQ0306773.1 hypothetical protein [Kitasatospora herbaricolor]GGV50935.1 hypothetical protein GCM10010495_80720 [Kitasatospora herbaricolor]